MRPLNEIEHVSPNFLAKSVLKHLQPCVWLLVTVVFFSTAMAQTPVTINRSTTLEQTLKPGVSHAYAVRLERGESAEVVVRQQGVDVIVDVRNPAGKLLDSIDSPTGRNGDETVEIIAQESGIYGITVRPFDSNEPAGGYRLEVRALRDARETTELLRTRREARNAAAQWLRPRSAAIARSGIIPTNVKVPLLDELAGRVRVVGLGEATHGSREFNDLRFSLTRYLVERHGFRVIALEASASNLSQVASYINGESELTPAMSGLIESNIWIGQRTRRELIEWVHRWNKGHPKDRVQVIGVDASENPGARETLRVFLSRAYGEDLMKRWTAAERELAAADEQTAVFGDSGVDAATRQLLLEVVAGMKLDAPILKSRFGALAFDSALEAAQTLAEFADFNSGSDAAISHSRDWYMAARVLRALQEKGASAKVVYWAHNAHVVHPPKSDRTTGAVLRNALGCEYAALAVTFGEGAFVAQIPNDLEDRLAVSTLPPASDGSIESVLRESRSDGTLANWPCVTPTSDTDIRAVPEWLKIARPMHWIGGLYKPDSMISEAFRNFNLLQDFDGIIYLPRVTAEDIPADRPLIPARKR
ncbi:MAG: erythromycin esterase family protein [Pyrinomonadaceae bacterium]